ncbi:hypothetical protein [Dyadobacter sp. CY343]|jgi:hypothetical protein|uniref:hypothetical protein n=1 Tax=Dyadobacter sp. CY343 TaxID=2907299 RepID=UPI001F360B02|nr:hypothetical protein [Dyadobacter sp. CY343]MCE7058675.1 hypothetical protein [Dyadobacter sp. CY343]
MIKRTFVLFFCLVHVLVSPVFAERTVSSCKLEAGAGTFSIHENQDTREKDIVLEDDTIRKNLTIVRADEFEWQESLNDLLRHRHSSFRFLTIVDQASPEYNITIFPKIIRESVTLPIISRSTFVLPGYYSFLHRLCPF